MPFSERTEEDFYVQKLSIDTNEISFMWKYILQINGEAISVYFPGLE